MQLKCRKTKTDLKNRQRTSGQIAHEKMLSIIREMQLKTIMRYHLTPFEQLLKRQGSTDIGEDVEKGDTFALLVRVHIGIVTMENSMRFFNIFN